MINKVTRNKDGTWLRIGENYDSGWRIYSGESAEILDKLFGKEEQ